MGSPPLAALDSPMLGDYVEVVLCDDHLELVLSGMGRAADLVALAEEQGFHPEIVAAFKTLTKVFEEAGYTNRRIYVDYAGPMDTVVCQWEFDSLDQYFTMERAFFVNPDENAQSLIDTFNSNAVSGYKEIYEVIQ